MRPDTGDTAWLLASTALVLLMTPALALFYGGLVRRKNVLSTIMHSLVSIPVITTVWLVLGYSLAFGPSVAGLIGGLDFFMLRGLDGQLRGTVPALAFVGFQAMFAVITPALISGGFAERMKFTAFLLFIVSWSLLVYAPLAHWVWAEGGWLFALGALDFAGGTVVHISAGVSALVCAVMVGKRLKYPQERPLPHNLTMTMLGAGLLWFGWFGFNAGSALAAGQSAALAFVTTHVAAGADDDHGDVARRADPAADLLAVHVGQAEVEEHDVGGLDRCDRREGGTTGGDVLDVEALGPQAVERRGGHGRVVLHHEDAHGAILARCGPPGRHRVRLPAPRAADLRRSLDDRGPAPRRPWPTVVV